jgi:S-sulfosulfanyl-L-cysteine sulfohydrolase
MSKNGQLTIVQMNDSHAYFELHPELFWSGGQAVYRHAGGYARIATLLKQIHAENQGAVLALDCGDTIHGTYAAVQTQGQALVPVLNHLAFVAMTAHWEFAYGPEQFKRIVQQLSYPMLAVNCYSKATGELVFEPYRICELQGWRIGIVGVAATIVDKVMPESFSEGITFTLGNKELPGTIARLREEEHVDLVVVISHLGFPQELQLAQEVDGIDVLLSAHTHNRLYTPATPNNTIVMQSGAHGAFVGRLDLHLQDGRLANFTHRLIPVTEDIEPDAEVEALVEQALAPYRAQLGQIAGQTLAPLNRNTALEATTDNFLLRSLRHVTGTELVFSNGWRYGAPIVPGPITVNDLYNIVPMDPPVSLVKLTGGELRAMLEENLEHTFSRDPYKQMGGYVKRCLGLHVYFKMENPCGCRIQELFVGNQPVKDDRLYTASFVTEQGVPARYGVERLALDIRAVEAMQRYLADHPRVAVELEGSVVAV